MGANSLDAFDKTPHATRVRLADLMRREAIGPGQQAAWPVVGAGLRTVRDPGLLTLAAHLDAQSPLRIGGASHDRRPAPGHMRQGRKGRPLDGFMRPDRVQVRGTHRAERPLG